MVREEEEVGIDWVPSKKWSHKYCSCANGNLRWVTIYIGFNKAHSLGQGNERELSWVWELRGNNWRSVS